MYTPSRCSHVGKLGAEGIKGYALKAIQSTLSTSNVVEELFSSFAARWASTGFLHSPPSHLNPPSSHKEILNMEIQFLRETVIKNDPKLLTDHIQKMASGEAPFFPTTLSLVYDKVVERAFTKYTPFGHGPGGCTDNQSPFPPTPLPKPSTSTRSAGSSSTVGTTASPSNMQAPVPSTAIPTWLKCLQCSSVAWLRDLHEGLRCPRCPGRGKKGRPFMQCASCDVPRTTPRDDCPGKKCGRRFI